MKHSYIIGAILLILLILASTASALGVVTRTRQALSAGGAMVTNGGITIVSTMGQPIAGSGIMLGHGFWGPHSGGFPVYLPAVLRYFESYFEGPCEAEPNNSAPEANGQLWSGRVYCGYSNDDGLGNYNRDFFSFYLERSGSILVAMRNHPGVRPQLQLFYQKADSEHRVGACRGASCEIGYDGNPGQYYIYISAEPPYNATSPYTLQATFP